MPDFLKSRVSKAILLGLLVGLLGLVLGPFEFMRVNIEANIGLGLLFKFRGKIQAPADAVVVSIDKESSDQLGLEDNTDRWPRKKHAELVEVLAKEGARTIAFDVHFIGPKDTEGDKEFAAAIKAAGNVVLTEHLNLKETRRAEEGGPAYDLVEFDRPFEPFLRAAVATAPFTLSARPFKVNQYPTFQKMAGGVPTTPVIMYQLFSMQAYDGFIRLLEKVCPNMAGQLPPDREAAMKTESVTRLIENIRAVFKSDPSTESRMQEELEDSGNVYGDIEQKRKIRSLIKMYGGADVRYINYYGPPGTVTTIPFYKALKIRDGKVGDEKIDLKGKAVFVGLSEVLLRDRKDSFYTVFSGADDTFISGVEIMATSFLNLLTDTPVMPISIPAFILIILLWGILLGSLCRTFPVGISALVTVILCALYFFAAMYRFEAANTWYPVMIPLFAQAPVAFFGGVLWNYAEINKERKNIKEAVTHYLPKDVVDRLAKDIAHIQADSRIVYGVCLFTDAQQYTSISENMDPKELGRFMNQYYETMFKPVKEHGGAVSGITGDAMLALWVSATPDSAIKDRACLAALDINRELERFTQSSDTVKIKTRIGLHCGQILLGSVGALDHYEYTPMGDIVNTASRIEGLNKYMGTAVMVSEEVLEQHPGFLTRELGKFRLMGKIKPVAVYELVCRIEEADDKKRSAYTTFAEGLEAFRKKMWEEAVDKFRQAEEILGVDEASHFYTELCEGYKRKPPEETWNGVVSMEQK